ncbi:MAG: recombinase RecT [bacterium]|nr:recombinase RecT [bacterium]
MTEALATRPDTAIETMVHGWIQYASGAFPDDIPDEKLKRAATRLKVAILSVPKVDKCSGVSIGKCIALSAMTELYPGAGEIKPDVWLIPRDVKDKKTGRVIRTDLNWQMGWRAYKRLAWRTGWNLTATLVYDGEPFAFYGGTEPRVEHQIDIAGEPSWERMRGGYVVATGPNGERDARWLTKEQILKRRRVAQTDNVWSQWPLEMALKTLYAYAGGREMFVMDSVTARAIAADNLAETGGLTAVVESRRRPSTVSAALAAGPATIETQAEPIPAEDVSQAPPVAAETVSQGEPGREAEGSQEEMALPRLQAMVKANLLDPTELTDGLRAADLIGTITQWGKLQADVPWAEVEPVVAELRAKR